jgi:hypothetical protein
MGYQLANLTGGGEGSLGITPWNKGKPWSDEVKVKCGLLNKGNTHWIGRKHSEESKIKMSESRKGNKNHAFGKKMSDETKLKLSIAHTGKKYSTERVAQMKITFGGKNNPMYGKKMSDESKEKMKKSLTGRKMSDEAKKICQKLGIYI